MYSAGYTDGRYMKPLDDKIQFLQVICVCSSHYTLNAPLVVLFLLLYGSCNMNLQYFSAA
jgi:hypothetical protein